MTGSFCLEREGERVVDMTSYERHSRLVGTAQGSAQMFYNTGRGLRLLVNQILLLPSHRFVNSETLDVGR